VSRLGDGNHAATAASCLAVAAEASKTRHVAR
jgi:hypothetical protein